MNSNSSNFANSSNVSAEEFDPADFCFFKLYSGPFKDINNNSKPFVMARHKGNGGWIPWDKDGARPFDGEKVLKLHDSETNDCFVLTGIWVRVEVKTKEVKKFEYSF